MRKILPYLTNFVIILGLLLGSIYYVTVDTDFYLKQYVKNNTPEHIGISEEELMKVTNVLVDYMKGDVPSLEVESTIKGQVRQVFDQREKDHMVDVKILFQTLQKTIMLLGLIAIILILIAFIMDKKEGIRNLAKTFIKTAIGFAIVVGILGGIFVWNFDWFWTNFHLLVFTNDLWLLDPKVSIMINMFPLNFFYACCFRILIIFTADIILLGLISYTVKNKYEKI